MHCWRKNQSNVRSFLKKLRENETRRDNYNATTKDKLTRSPSMLIIETKDNHEFRFKTQIFDV